MLHRVLIFFAVISFNSSYAQNIFYNIDTIREIRLYFHESNWDASLDSLYIQKSTMTEYEALIVFRNTEIWPKTYMDFEFLYEMLAGFTPYKVRCTLFSCFLTSSFINMHQAPTAAMMMRKYGITSWNPSFKEMLVRFKDKFGDPAVYETVKMQWIKRVLKRTYALMEEDGVDIDMLIGD